MWVSTEQLMNMARHGAAAMIAELKSQIAEIERAFPSVKTARRAAVRTVSGAPNTRAARRPRTMSAAQKKAVSARMKKYWAARRAAKARTAGAKK